MFSPDGTLIPASAAPRCGCCSLDQTEKQQQRSGTLLVTQKGDKSENHGRCLSGRRQFTNCQWVVKHNVSGIIQTNQANTPFPPSVLPPAPYAAVHDIPDTRRPVTNFSGQVLLDRRAPPRLSNPSDSDSHCSFTGDITPRLILPRGNRPQFRHAPTAWT